MPAINLADDLKVGAAQVDAAYLGGTMIWPATTTLPTIADLGGAAGQAAGTTLVSSSLAPVANSLLIVAAAAPWTAANGVTFSTTLANVGSWTYIRENDPTNVFSIVTGYARITGAPGTGTITVTGTTISRRIMRVFGVENFNTTTPIAHTVTGESNIATLTATLGVTPAASSTVLALVGSRTPSVNIVPSLTEIGEWSSTGTSPSVLEAAFDAGSAAAAASWSGLGTTANAAVVYEIAAP